MAVVYTIITGYSLKGLREVLKERNKSLSVSFYNFTKLMLGRINTTVNTITNTTKHVFVFYITPTVVPICARSVEQVIEGPFWKGITQSEVS